ncbi:sensor histidine kinase [Alkaliphilus crotonatoxidans]
MKTLTDKFIILAVSLMVYLLYIDNQYLIVPVLVSISLSALLGYFQQERVRIGLFAVFLIICILKPPFLFFLPLICYDIVLHRINGLWGVALLPLLVDFIQNHGLHNWLIAALLFVVWLLRHRTASIEGLEHDYHVLRDNAKEISMQLERQNKELIERQDDEVNLATLSERNRIARDIHDNVGHLLSRSILQVGALLATNQDLQTKNDLKMIKDTLAEAMNSIRANVHNLYEESIDLYIEVQKLIAAFQFCPVTFDYDVASNPEKSIKYCFIAVIKEALSNISRHSNATEASVKIYEHPALYQLIVQDNGTGSSYHTESGIGIKNMTDRVASMGGTIHISTNKGFRIFISIQKNQRN